MVMSDKFWQVVADECPRRERAEGHACGYFRHYVVPGAGFGGASALVCVADMPPEKLPPGTHVGVRQWQAEHPDTA